MRKINNPIKRGFRIVSITDSITGKKSTATYMGDGWKRCWIKSGYYSDGYPSKANIEELWVLEDGDKTPEPKEGWSYGVGSF